jgi:hypothetical protein
LCQQQQQQARQIWSVCTLHFTFSHHTVFPQSKSQRKEKLFAFDYVATLADRQLQIMNAHTNEISLQRRLCIHCLDGRSRVAIEEGKQKFSCAWLFDRCVMFGFNKWER